MTTPLAPLHSDKPRKQAASWAKPEATWSGTSIASNPAPGIARQQRPEDTALFGLFRNNAFEQHFQPNSTILLHGDRADAIYHIVSGTVRCCTIDHEGRRQIFSFPKKGDYVGLSDLDTWHFTAEAVDHVIVKSVPRAVVEQELAVNLGLRQEIRAYVRGLLCQREQQLLMVTTTKGPARLLHFLESYATTRKATGFVVLPMCRRDIADHIGLSTEGVSRAFSQLKCQGLIELKSSEKYRIVTGS